MFVTAFDVKYVLKTQDYGLMKRLLTQKAQI